MSEKKIVLMTPGKYVLAGIAVLIGALSTPVHEWWTTGHASGLTIGAACAALAVGVVIVTADGRYANRPEGNSD